MGSLVESPRNFLQAKNYRVRRRTAVCLFSFLFLSPFFLFAAPPATTDTVADSTSTVAKTGARYNRRVLLINFVNGSQNDASAYLSQSIPEAFGTTLLKTDQFAVLNSDSVEKYVTIMGIHIRDLYKEENAVRLGKVVGAGGL